MKLSGSYAWIAAGFLVALTTSGAAVGQDAPPDSREEQIAVARSATSAALDAMQRGDPGWDDRVRAAASALGRVELFDEAIAALREVSSRSDSPFDVAEAFRMMGQNQIVTGDHAGAEASFRSALEVIDVNPSLESRGLSFASVVSQYASVLAVRGDYAAAARVNQRLIDALSVDEDIRAGALVSQSRYLGRDNQPQAAAAALDRVFAEFPTYIERRNAEIALRLKRAEYRDPERSGEAWLDELRSMWSDTRLRGDPNILTVGELLIQATGARRLDNESLQAAIDIVTLIDAKRADWTGADAPRPVRSAWINDHQTAALSVLSSAEGRGRPDLAYWALDRLIMRTESPQDRANYERHKAAIDHKIILEAQIAREQR